MKKIIVYALCSVFVLSLSSFEIHKFYMAIYQINYAPEKKMLQITSRIFIDDLNKALEGKYKKKFHLGVQKEDEEEINLFGKYIAENFSLKVNGQIKKINFLSMEVDGDVLVCYLNIKDISKMNTLEIYNSVLTDWILEQQNIVHVTAFGTKNSFLFTATSTKQVLKF